MAAQRTTFVPMGRVEPDAGVQTAVTAEQVKQAAQKYLVAAHRSVVITLPGAASPAAGAAGMR